MAAMAAESEEGSAWTQFMNRGGGEPVSQSESGSGDKQKKKRRLPPALTNQLKKIGTKIKDTLQFPGKVLNALTKIDPAALGPLVAAALATTTVATAAGIGYAVANEREDGQIEEEIASLDAEIDALDNDSVRPALAELAERLRDIEGIDAASAEELGQVAARLDGLASVDEIAGLASVEDLDGLIGPDALEGLVAAAELEGLASAEDLDGLASVEDLEGLIGPEALADLATTEDIVGLATAEAVEAAIAEVEASIPDEVDLAPVLDDLSEVSGLISANQAAIQATNEALVTAEALEALRAATEAVQEQNAADLAEIRGIVESIGSGGGGGVGGGDVFDPTALEAADAEILAQAEQALADVMAAQAQIDQTAADIADLEAVFFGDLVDRYEAGIVVPFERLACTSGSRYVGLDPGGFGTEGILQMATRGITGETVDQCTEWRPIIPDLPSKCSYNSPSGIVRFEGLRSASFPTGSSGTVRTESNQGRVGVPGEAGYIFSIDTAQVSSEPWSTFNFFATDGSSQNYFQHRILVIQDTGGQNNLNLSGSTLATTTTIEAAITCGN